MTASKAGGQTYAEKPPENDPLSAKKAQITEDEEPPVEPPRPQLPYKLSDESSACPDIESDTGKQCCIRRVNVDDPKSKCVKHAWQDAHRAWQTAYDLWEKRKKVRK